MKALFSAEVIFAILKEEDCAADGRSLLNACQEKRLDGYICIDTLVQLFKMLDADGEVLQGGSHGRLTL